jgi:predicted NBD/HSP70 family sugar kinase
MKQNNMTAVIQAVLTRKAVSKTDIADLCGITYVTAHSIVNELVKKSVCLEDGTAQSGGGRKTVLYKINGSYCHILGVELFRRHIYVTIHDFGLSLLYEKETPCDPSDANGTVLLMARCLQGAIESSGIPKGSFLGVGVSCPGRMNQNTGVIIHIPALANWNNIPAKQIISKLLGLPVFVENDVNARLLAMKWLGDTDGAEDMALVTITEGVGLGILSAGKLLMGAHSYAAEIGHTTLQYDGRLCVCGNRGCVETFVAPATIIEKARPLYSFDQTRDINLQDVIAAAKSPGGHRVYDVLVEVSGFMAILLEHLVKTYDPSVILMESNWLHDFPEIFESIKKALFAKCSWLNSSMIDIQLVRDRDYWRSSMACLVLEKVVDHRQNDFFNEFYAKG